ncbi:putative aaa family atpase protein [Eutypa lata UCREL1]|uniref:Putative aaa family atpase protein n=1 Tax=Eutypa lata (strain UCR-EL1) TaxID=1287681 RepID=M7T097_EUTLA|nr:putative aaa family atpase protein [Eutypa lata UCREL1]
MAAKDKTEFFGNGFEEFPRRLPENCVEYMIFIIDSQIESRKLLSDLEAIRKAAVQLCERFTKGYIWQRDVFQLQAKNENGLVYLHGTTDYGDSVEDEWLIVFLLHELTKSFPSLWVKSQRFKAPPSWNEIIDTAEREVEVGSTEESLKRLARLEMGMKVTSGFEMLAANADKRDNRLAREFSILLEDLEEDGDQVLPTNEEVKTWPEANRDDDEAWLDINFEDFENELQGKRGAKRSSQGGFGDTSTQADIQKMVSRFEAFLNDETAGVEGAELEDMDEDDDSSDEEDDSEDEDKEVSFDEEEFAKMMREMMGMPSEKGITKPTREAVKYGSQEKVGEDEEEEEEDIRQLAAQMESELKEHGALKLDPGPKDTKTKTIEERQKRDAKGKGKGKEIQGAKEEGEDEGESGDEEIDIDYNLAKNLLESFKSQAGMAGPTSNILGMMGMQLPRDEDEEEATVYYESQGDEKEATACWKSALDQIQQNPVHKKQTNYAPKSETERALLDSIKELEVQCKERIDLLEALRISREEDPSTQATPSGAGVDAAKNGPTASSSSDEESEGPPPPSQRRRKGKQKETPIDADTRAQSQSPTADSGDNGEKEKRSSWERRRKAILKNLPPGVDEAAAKAIFNEIVVHGDEVHWSDVAGLEVAKTALRETVVYPFLRPDLFMGLREPARGMLLFGPPGTGKTMLARAVATESRSAFFSISASSLTSKYLGESEKLVRALFALAKLLAPSIIFVDEIDSLLSQRSGSGEHEATRRIKTEFLIQWSDLQRAAAGRESSGNSGGGGGGGGSSSPGGTAGGAAGAGGERGGGSGDPNRVLVLAATNLPWAIDEAARRRFVRRQYIPLPEPETRGSQLRTLLSQQKHSLTDADIADLVGLTDGFSGSDITALAKDAAMGPLRSLGEALLHMTMDQIRPIEVADFHASLRMIRPSVSKEGLKEYEDWARQFGERGG